MATQLEKKVIQPGNKTDYPKTGDEVTIQYTGWLHEPSKAANGYKGKQYVTLTRGRESVNSSPLQVLIFVIPDSTALLAVEISRLKSALEG